MGKHGCQYLIYAVLGAMSLDEVARRYRALRDRNVVSILGQALARTSSRSPALRLLQVGVGMLLQNEWTILRLMYASEGRQCPVGFRIRKATAVRRHVANAVAGDRLPSWEPHRSDQPSTATATPPPSRISYSGRTVNVAKSWISKLPALRSP